MWLEKVSGKFIGRQQLPSYLSNSICNFEILSFLIREEHKFLFCFGIVTFVKSPAGNQSHSSMIKALAIAFPVEKYMKGRILGFLSLSHELASYGKIVRF